MIHLGGGANENSNTMGMHFPSRGPELLFEKQTKPQCSKVKRVLCQCRWVWNMLHVVHCSQTHSRLSAASVELVTILMLHLAGPAGK